MAIPTPQPEALLPPLLACLPTSFVSSRPPPALLPLLSPILRQRLQYSTDTSTGDGWLPLLCWDPQRASRLSDKVASMHIEPHPVSGEVEIEHTGRTQYKRLDEETLQVRFELEQYDLLPIYVWCESDEHAGTGPGWRLAELQPLDTQTDGNGWSNNILDAEKSYTSPPLVNGHKHEEQETEVDDDDYWAAYDRTPGRTPSVGPPNGAQQPFSTMNGTREVAETDDAYYSRYGSVQPAMDNHDPDEAPAAALASPQSIAQPMPHGSANHDDDRPIQRSLYPAAIQAPQAVHASTAAPVAPRPISPASSTSSVEKLEKRASAEADMTRVETGVKQHISSQVRNLFRLARSVGMEIEEFRDTVSRELDVLAMLEDS